MANAQSPLGHFVQVSNQDEKSKDQIGTNGNAFLAISRLKAEGLMLIRET